MRSQGLVPLQEAEKRWISLQEPELRKDHMRTGRRWLSASQEGALTGARSASTLVLHFAATRTIGMNVCCLIDPIYGILL